MSARALEPGDRVTLANNPAHSAGTVEGINERGAVSVMWDMSYYGKGATWGAAELELDASLPDAKLALAKALEFKRQRDECLKQLWETTDAVAVAGLARVRAEVKLAEAQARADAQAERATDAEQRIVALNKLLNAFTEDQ